MAGGVNAVNITKRIIMQKKKGIIPKNMDPMDTPSATLEMAKTSTPRVV